MSAADGPVGADAPPGPRGGRRIELGPARRTAVFGYLNFVTAALVALVTSPILVAHLGPAAFGHWKALQRIMEVAASLDGKPAQALKSLLAGRLHEADPKGRRALIGAAAVAWIAWLPVLILLVGAAAVAFPATVRGIAPSAATELSVAGGLLALNALLATAVGLPCAVLIAANRGHAAMLAMTLGLVLTNLGIVLAVARGGGLAAMAVLTCVGTLVTGAVAAGAMRRSVPWWRPARPTRREVRRVAGYGAWINGWAFVATLMLASEVVMLSALVGPEAVAAYTFSAFGAQFAASIALMTASALAPTLAAALGAGRADEAAATVRIARELVLTVSTLAASAIILANQSFVTLWAGREQFVGGAANVWIAVAGLQVALIRCEAQILESGQSIRRAVAIGLASSVAAAGAGSAAYLATDSIPWMIAGLVAGRLGMSVALPVLVVRMQPSSGYPLRSAAAAALVLALSIAASRWIGESREPALVAACVAGAALASALAIPSPGTLRRIAGGPAR